MATIMDKPRWMPTFLYVMLYTDTTVEHVNYDKDISGLPRPEIEKIFMEGVEEGARGFRRRQHIDVTPKKAGKTNIVQEQEPKVRESRD